MPKPLEIMIQTKNNLEIFYEDDTDYSDVYVIMLEMLVKHNVAEFKTDPKTRTQYLELTPATFNHALSVLDNFDIVAMSKEWALRVEDITTGKKIIDSYIINQLDQENLVSVTFKIQHYDEDQANKSAPLKKEAHYYLATWKRVTIGISFILLGLVPSLTFIALNDINAFKWFSQTCLILLLLGAFPIALGLNQLFYKPYLLGINEKELYFSLWLDYKSHQGKNKHSKKYILLIFPRKSKQGVTLNLTDIHAYQFKENSILNTKHLDIQLKSGNTQTLSLDLLSQKDYLSFKEMLNQSK